LEPGTIINRYKVIGLLGEGGIGQVYHVRDTELGREVALKCFNHKRFGIEQAETFLRREAQAMAQVEHPAVIRIYDVGASAGHLFVTMELARGGTLSAWARARPRVWREVFRAFIEAGRGLAAAHRVGLVHCDIKPENILFDSYGCAKISDFGLARTLDARIKGPHVDSSSATTFEASVAWTGVIEGTIPYMAPEQLSGGLVDVRADQFAFCVALWELLCGRRPFRVPDGTLSPAAFLKAITANAIDDPVPREEVLRRVLMVVRRGLAAEQNERWRSMDDLLDALERAAFSSCKSRLATWR
jgi:serine/threonine protein kinase